MLRIAWKCLIVLLPSASLCLAQVKDDEDKEMTPVPSLEPPALPDIDPAFKEFDFSELRSAWLGRDAAKLTEFGLSLAAIEKSSGKTLKGFTASQVLGEAIGIAAEKRDRTALDKLAEAVAKLKDAGLDERLAVAKQIAASPVRASDPALSVSLETTPREIVARIQDYLEAIGAILRSGDAAALSALVEEVQATKELTEAQRAALLKKLAQAKKDLPTEPSKDNDLLQKLAASSRASASQFQWHYSVKSKMSFYKQEQSNWCWAACTKMTVYCYTKSELSQSRLAARFIAKKPGTDVCDGTKGAGKACNQPFVLTTSLEYYGRSKAFYSAGEISDNLISAELKAGRPVLLRIGWPNETGHFIILHGAGLMKGLGLVDNVVYDVFDPITGHTTAPRAGIELAYKSRGKLTHIYFTK